MGLSRWAWQNFHITKKVTEQQREEQIANSGKPLKRKRIVDVPPAPHQQCQKKKRPRRPQVTLKNALTNLHVLLRVPSFNRLPLEVRFFCDDVHNEWLQYNEKACGEFRHHLHVTKDIRDSSKLAAEDERHVDPQTGHKRKFAPSGLGGVEGIDVSYSRLKTHVKKSIRLLVESDTKRCSVCVTDLEPQSSTAVTCPADECPAMFHMACIAKQRSDAGISGDILPISVRCPRCHSEHSWVDLVKELSIRVRGGKDLSQLTRVPREPRAAAGSASNGKVTANLADTETAEVAQRFEKDLADIDHLVQDAEDDPLPDDWHELGEDSDSQSLASTDTEFSSRPGSPVRPKNRRQQLPVVIEDSEWDSAEALD
ncbi:MAG: hypothetical protein LQ338_005351 [Usnochroma carphineum]|nr:MAG: hypothetical protein LQ338_005351 [Usnochroma carphineum]